MFVNDKKRTGKTSHQFCPNHMVMNGELWNTSLIGLMCDIQLTIIGPGFKSELVREGLFLASLNQL